MGYFSLDESSKWNRYAVALPVSLRQIVGARYLVGFITPLIINTLGCVISFCIRLILKKPLLLLYDVIIACTLTIIVLLTTTIAFPLTYKFGTETTRYINSAIFLIPLILFTLLAQNQAVYKLAEQFMLNHLVAFVSGVCFAAIALFVASFLISCQIYRKKEF